METVELGHSTSGVPSCGTYSASGVVFMLAPGRRGDAILAVVTLHALSNGSVKYILGSQCIAPCQTPLDKSSRTWRGRHSMWLPVIPRYLGR